MSRRSTLTQNSIGVTEPRTRNRTPSSWGVEPLEQRLALSGSPAAVFKPPPPYSGAQHILPPISGLPTIELPPGASAPPGAQHVPPPISGPILSDFAEKTAANTGAAFLKAHPKATIKATDHTSKGTFTLTIKEADAHGDTFVEQIIESRNSVSVTMSEIDGKRSEKLTSNETTPTNHTKPAGSLVDSVFTNGRRTSYVHKKE